MVCEPVIIVRWQGMCGKQLCSMEQLENKLADMREFYNEKLQVQSASSNQNSEEDDDLNDIEDSDRLLKEHRLSNFMLESIFECQVKIKTYFYRFFVWETTNFYLK